MGDEPCSGPPLAQNAIRRVTPSEEPNDHFMFAEHSTGTLPNPVNARYPIATPCSTSARDLVFPEWEATDLRQFHRDLQQITKRGFRTGAGHAPRARVI